MFNMRSRKKDISTNENSVLLINTQIPLTHIWIVSIVSPPLLQENVLGTSGRLLLSELRFIGLRNSVPDRYHLNILKLPLSLGSHSSNTSVLSTPTIYVYVDPVTATRNKSIQTYYFHIIEWWSHITLTCC